MGPRRAVNPRPYSGTLSIALEFKRVLDSRGIQLILTHVYSQYNLDKRREVVKLAAALRVPFIAPVVDRLITRDGAHLDDESARRFGERFITEFDAWLKESGARNKH